MSDRKPLKAVASSYDADGFAQTTPTAFREFEPTDVIPAENVATLTSPENGQAMRYRDGAILNVSETYHRLDTEYGVVADDSTDNTAAILSALEDRRDAHGGTIVFPNGVTKMIGSTLVDFNNKFGTLKVLGDHNSVIRIGGGTAAQVPSPGAFYVGNCPDVIFQGLAFIGTPGNDVQDFAKAVLFLAGGDRAIVRDCRFMILGHVNASEDVALNKGDGIVVGFQNDLVVEGCRFGGNMTWNCPNVGVYDYRSLTIRDTSFLDYAQYGTGTINKIGGTYFTKYWIRAVLPQAIGDSGWHRSKVTLERINTDEANVNGIVIDGAEFVEMNSVGQNIGSQNSISLSNVKRARLRSCVIGAYAEVTIDALLAHNCEIVEIEDMKLSNETVNINLTGTTRRLMLRGNQGITTITNTANAFVDADQAMPSSASVAALVVKGKTTHVTGTTNITSIDTTNLKPGDTFTLIFDGILTVTHGSNIKLAGGANFTTAAHSVLRLEYDGTNCYELSRKA